MQAHSKKNKSLHDIIVGTPISEQSHLLSVKSLEKPRVSMATAPVRKEQISNLQSCISTQESTHFRCHIFFFSSQISVPREILGSQQNKVRSTEFCSGWCSSVDWVSLYEPKGHWFNSQSGHMPGLQAGGVKEAITHGYFSPSLSPSLPFSLKINKIIFKKCKTPIYPLPIHTHKLQHYQYPQHSGTCYN